MAAYGRAKESVFGNFLKRKPAVPPHDILAAA
jgi:hypothetical protein